VVGTVDKTTGENVGVGTNGDGENEANEATAGAEITADGMVATELVGTVDGTDEAETITNDGLLEMVTTGTPDGTSDDLMITGDGGNELAGGKVATWVTATGDGDGAAATGVGV
jgi:hypothetical protein